MWFLYAWREWAWGRRISISLPLSPRYELPAGVNLRFVIGASDGFTQFCSSSIRIKIDAVPGRINQVPVYVTVPVFTMDNVQSYVVLVMDLCQLD